MEFARRGPATAAADDDGRRFPDPPPPHGDAMLVIRDALMLQLQMDRLREEIIMTELAKIERSMALGPASCHGVVAADAEWAKLASSFSARFMPHCRWPVIPEHYSHLDDLYELKKGARQGGLESRSLKPAMEDSVGECSRSCCTGKEREEKAAFDELKLQESNENIQPKEPSLLVKWELTGITMPVKKPKSLQKWSCTICNVKTNSKRQLQQHCAGRKHRSNVAALESRNKTISQKAETTAEPSSCVVKKTSPIKWSCSTCQANGTSEADLKEHLNGSTHQRKVEVQCKEGDGMAKVTELQEAKSHLSNVPENEEKPPPIWSCSDCTSESELRSHLLAKIQALQEEINNMAGNSESRESKFVPKHAEQASPSNRSICQANCDYKTDLANHIGGKLLQLNVQGLHKEAKQKENITPQIVKNHQPPSEWDCSICQAKCYSESQLENHCSGRKHQKKILALQGEAQSGKSSGLNTENKVPSNVFDSMSSTLDKVEEQMIPCVRDVCKLLCSSENIVADHCMGEEHLEKSKLLNFCEVCNLQCNSEKMLAHHCTGKKHLKKLNAKN